MVIIFILMVFASACASLLPLINRHIIDNGILNGRIDIIIIFTGIAFSLFLCEKFFELIETRVYVYTDSLVSFTILKDTSLVQAIAMEELMRSAQLRVSATGRPWEPYLVAGCLYLFMTTIFTVIFSGIEKKLSVY